VGGPLPGARRGSFLRMSNPLHRIPKHPLQRRLALSLAGLKGGSRLAFGHFGNLLKSGDARVQANAEVLGREARAFVDELGRLKGAYVKIGQMFGIYGEHVLPDPIVDALRALNDQTPPLTWAAIEPALRAELGDTIDTLEIEPQPLAAASLSQVHRARRKADGRALCLKIQYPGVAEAIESDFDDVIRFMQVSRWLTRDASAMSVIEDLRNLLRQEVDYRREAAAATDIAARLAGDERYRVPAIDVALSTPRLLVMEEMQGYKLDSPEVAAMPARHRNRIAQALLDLLLTELFDWQLMQTDPNLGNYLVTLQRGRPALVLLDFGAVRPLDAQFAGALSDTVRAAAARDRDATVAGLRRMGFLREGQGEQAQTSFAEFCFLVAEPLAPQRALVPESALTAGGAYRWKHAGLLRRIGNAGLKSATGRDFRLPNKEFSLMLRKLAGVFNAMVLLDAEFDVRRSFAPYAGAPSRTAAAPLNAAGTSVLP